MKINVIVTTIHTLDFIDKFYRNIEVYEDTDHEVTFIVVLDNKQAHPLHTGDMCITSEIWTPDEQKIWLESVGIKNYDKIIPENSPRRRNFGYLRSLEMQPDVTIVIDDDNLAGPDPFFSCHAYPFNRGNEQFPLVASRNKIVDHNKTLIMNYNGVYPRGYPLGGMYGDTWHCWGPKRYDCDNKKVACHMGLWLNKPDVDAISNITYPDLEVEGRYQYSPYYELDNNNYISINSQNTSFNQDVAKIFWNVHQGKVNNLVMNRYDDIWNGLFVQKIAHRRGEAITFGVPLTMHNRNTHNFTTDLQNEFVGMLANTRMWEFILNLRLESKNYIDAYLEIAHAIKTSDVTKDYWVEIYMKELAKSMEEWIEAVDKIV